MCTVIHFTLITLHLHVTVIIVDRDKAVQRVETLVLPNLASYARICDCIKADVWNAIQAIKREKRRKKSVKILHKKSEDPKTKSCLVKYHFSTFHLRVKMGTIIIYILTGDLHWYKLISTERCSQRA